jgi:hypothetical protein
LALLVPVLALSLFVALVERDLPSSEQREQRGSLVLEVDPEAVVRLRIEAEGAATTLERTAEEEGGWRLVTPPSHAADTTLVDTLLDTVAGLERSRSLDEWQPAAVGLDRPRARLVVETDDGASTTLLVGSEVPASRSMIVAVEGHETAQVVASSLWPMLARSAGAWRSRDVYTGDRESVRSLHLKVEAGAEAMRLERVGGSFRVRAPYDDLADRESVDALLRELGALRVAEFVDGPLGPEAGLDPPRALLEVFDVSGAVFRLDWGGEAAEGSFARVGDVAFITAARLAESFAIPTEGWRSRSWSELPVYRVAALEVTAGGRSASLRREEGDWRLGETKIEHSLVADLLYAIDEIEVERFAMHEAASGQAPAPLARLRLVSVESDESVLELFAPARREELGAADEAWPARSQGREPTLLLPRAGGEQVWELVQALLAAVA